MIRTNSLEYKIINFLMNISAWYFKKRNYVFSYKYVYIPEKEKEDQIEKSYMEKFWKTKEGKKELQEREKRIQEFIKKIHNR